MSIVLELKNVNKSYNNIKAIDNVSLSIEENKLYGLLGRNGAGKTTLLKLITNLIYPDSNNSNIKVFGESSFENSKVLEKICFVRESEYSYYKDFKVKNIFKNSSIIYKYWSNDFQNELIHSFDLDVNKIYSKLSKGNQSIVKIIIGLASRSPLTIFDEPYLGLDAVYRQTFYDILLRDYMENPRTIILSTHLIEEMDKIFEEVIIIDKGKLLLKENVDVIENKGYILGGRTEIIDEISKGKSIINEETLGNYKTIAIYNYLKEIEISNLKNSDITIGKLPLQKFFIYLSKKNSETKGVDINEPNIF